MLSHTTVTGINLQTGGDYVGLLTAPTTLIFSKLRKQKKTLQCKYLLYTFKVGAGRGRSWQQQSFCFQQRVVSLLHCYMSPVMSLSPCPHCTAVPDTGWLVCAPRTAAHSAACPHGVPMLCHMLTCAMFPMSALSPVTCHLWSVECEVFTVTPPGRD